MGTGSAESAQPSVSASSGLRRDGSCGECGRPHLTENGKRIRGCLCHWHATRYRGGASHGLMEPVVQEPAPPTASPDRAPWPWTGWLG